MYELYKHCTNIYEPNYIYEMDRGWLRPNVASAPWKVFLPCESIWYMAYSYASWIRPKLRQVTSAAWIALILRPESSSPVLASNTLEPTMRYLGANKNAADIRKNNRIYDWWFYAPLRLHTRKECLMKALYHIVHGHSLKGVVSSQSGHCVCPLSDYNGTTKQTNIFMFLQLVKLQKVTFGPRCVRNIWSGCNMPPMTINEWISGIQLVGKNKANLTKVLGGIREILLAPRATNLLYRIHLCAHMIPVRVIAHAHRFCHQNDFLDLSVLMDILAGYKAGLQPFPGLIWMIVKTSASHCLSSLPMCDCQLSEHAFPCA